MVSDKEKALKEKKSDEKVSSDKTSSEETLMHLLKGNIGTGILAMPKAFAHVGLLFGTVGIPILGFLCTHCMHMLITTQKHLSVAEKAVSVGPLMFRRFSSHAKIMVSAFLMATQLGICSVYALFVAVNLKAVLIEMNIWTPDTALSDSVFVFCLLPIMIVLNCVKNLKHLAIASTCANILQISGLMIICYSLTQDLPHSSERPLFTSFSKIPLYFSTAIFAFEGISIVLPIYSEMRKPSTFPGVCGVLNAGMILVTTLYLTIGFFGYLKYGDLVHGSVTLDLPNKPLYEADKIMFTVALFLSYPLQMYVPVNIVWPWVQSKIGKNSSPNMIIAIEFLYRSSMVAFTFTMAAVIPMLDKIIQLVGALSSSFVAVIFPPIVQVFALWEDRDKMSSMTWNYIIIKNGLMFSFGILGFLTGTYASILDIIEEIQK